MLIPADLESAEAFIERAANVLHDPSTRIYVDTSFAMWLTAVGQEARAAFFVWEASLADRVRVPAWTMLEFYRHHRARTMKKDVEKACAKLGKALGGFGSHMRVLAEGPLASPGSPNDFVRQLEQLKRLSQSVTMKAKDWDYDDAATEVIGWLNERPLGRSRAFRDFGQLQERGSARYGHRVPPGYEDLRKRRNKFGDLIFWQDVVADVRTRRAPQAVILTRDRKEDWYCPSSEPEMGPTWRRLRGRWLPVPQPHPMLAFELRSQAGAELSLLDELYLAAVLWRRDRALYGRFAAAGFGMGLDRLAEELAPRPDVAARAAARAAGDRISLVEVGEILDAAFQQIPSYTSTVTELLEALDGDAPDAEGAVEAVTVEWLMRLTPVEVAILARRLYDLSLAAHPFGSMLAASLLDKTDAVDAAHASGIVGGMLTAAYFDGEQPRNLPVGTLLQDVHAWRDDKGCQRMLLRLGKRLKDARSPALYLPKGTSERRVVRLEASSVIVGKPTVLGQVFIGAQPLLTEEPLEGTTSMSSLLTGREEATVAEIIAAVCRHYGVPSQALDLGDLAVDEPRTVLSTTRLERFSPLRQPIRSDASEEDTAGTERDGSATEAPEHLAPQEADGLSAEDAEDEIIDEREGE